jgi:hypothetical protein
MTAQFHDSVKYRRRWYDLAGVHGQGLFDPLAYGLVPTVRSTACWRGFVCQYKVASGELILDCLHISLGRATDATPGSGGPPELFGVRAKRQEGFLGWAFKRLHHPVSFSGGLLLARKFIKGLYVHMGFHPAWKFQSVVECLFDDGKLTKATDRSVEMARIRERMVNSGLRPGSDARRPEVIQWIEDCFDLDYDL